MFLYQFLPRYKKDNTPYYLKTAHKAVWVYHISNVYIYQGIYSQDTQKQSTILYNLGCIVKGVIKITHSHPYTPMNLHKKTYNTMLVTISCLHYRTVNRHIEQYVPDMPFYKKISFMAVLWRKISVLSSKAFSYSHNRYRTETLSVLMLLSCYIAMLYMVRGPWH